MTTNSTLNDVDEVSVNEEEDVNSISINEEEEEEEEEEDHYLSDLELEELEAQIRMAGGFELWPEHIEAIKALL